MDCVIQIVRVSIELLSSKLPLLLLITLVLIFPVSSITLSQMMNNSLLASQLSTFFDCRLRSWAGLSLSSFSRLFYSHLSQAAAIHALCFPIIITLWVLSKATIFYVLRCMKQGKEASVVGFLEEGPRIWCRVAMTYVSGCMLVVGMTGMLVLWEVMGLVMVREVTEEMQIINKTGPYIGVVCMFLEVSMVSMYAMILAPMVVVLHMSSVVAAMEERKSSGHAMVRALSLLKHRKLQPALLLFMITGTALAVIECAFQYRVLGRGTAFMATSTHLLEAPFLIFVHAFLCLLDTLMSFFFYYACQSVVDKPADCHCMGNIKEDVEDHFSIAMEIVEKQCRKIMSTI